jgi:hypothetical protein
MIEDHTTCAKSLGSINAGSFDGPGWNRTNDLGIKSPLLYQLSYRP